MSHPYYHAISSAKKFGGHADEYIAIHNWFDATKANIADQRHRMFRHHLQAIPSLCRDQGRSGFVNADGAVVTLDSIGRQHLAEDYGGYVPTHGEWVEAIGEQSWMRLAAGEPGAEALIVLCRRYGGSEADFRPLIDWFHEHTNNDPRSFYMRGNAAACFSAERLFGVNLLVGNRQLPTRLAAEIIVSRMFANRMIPTVADWVRATRRPAWCRQPEQLAVAA